MPASPNKLLQLTFDPPPTFAFAKVPAASNATELRRWASLEVREQERKFLIPVNSRAEAKLSHGRSGEG